MLLPTSFFQHFLQVRRTALGLLFMLAAPMLSAQQRTETGYLSEWTGELNVENGTLKNRGAELSGLTIPIYESDDKSVIKLWKSTFTTLGAKFKGSGPVKAVGMSIPGAPEVKVVFAEAMKGLNTDPTKLTLSFFVDDTTALKDQERMRGYMRDLATKLNRAVVQAQVNEQQKLVDKHAKKLGSAQQAEDKRLKKEASAKKDLDKASKEMSKLTSQQVGLQGDVYKYQRQYEFSKDPNDLKKLSKVQKKLVNVNSNMAKQLKKKAKTQKDMDVLQGQKPVTQQNKETVQGATDRSTLDMQDLKRKLEAIR